MPLTTAHPTFRTEPKPFTAAVTWVAKHLANRPVMPMLAGVLLEVEDGRLTASAFDNDVAVRARVDVVGETNGRTVVSGRLLAALVATFPDQPVDVTCTGAAMEITCGRIRVTLPTLPVEDYPALPTVPAPAGTIAGAAFADMTDRVAVAADRDLSGAIISMYAVRLELRPDEIEMIATDRFRAAIGHLQWQAQLSDERIAHVPSPTLIDAAKTFSASETVTIGLDDSGLIGFTSEDRSLTVRMLDVDFPIQMRGLFPERDSAAPTAPVGELADALKRANLVRNATGPALLTFTENGLIVEAYGDDNAKTAEIVDCNHQGKDVQFAMNPRFLLDALAALRSDTAEFTITTPIKPVLLTAPEDKGTAYTNLIVPIRVS
jgi:DNA polymerase-3 subunit beta